MWPQFGIDLYKLKKVGVKTTYSSIKLYPLAVVATDKNELWTQKNSSII